MRGALFLLLGGFLGVVAASAAPFFTVETDKSRTPPQSPVAKSAFLVQLRVEALRDESVGMTLADGKSFELARESFEKNALGYSVWTGASKENPGWHATFVERSGQVHGTITVAGKVFSLEPVSENSGHVLVEKDFSRIPDCGIAEGGQK